MRVVSIFDKRASKKTHTQYHTETPLRQRRHAECGTYQAMRYGTLFCVCRAVICMDGHDNECYACMYRGLARGRAGGKPVRRERATEVGSTKTRKDTSAGCRVSGATRAYSVAFRGAGLLARPLARTSARMFPLRFAINNLVFEREQRRERAREQRVEGAYSRGADIALGCQSGAVL